MYKNYWYQVVLDLKLFFFEKLFWLFLVLFISIWILRTIFSISSQKLQFWKDCSEPLHQLGEIYSNEASDTWIRHSPFFICLLSSLLAMFYSFYCTGISHVSSDLLPSLSYLKKKFCCRCFHFNFWLIVYNIWKCNWLLYIDLVCFNLPKLTK